MPNNSILRLAVGSPTEKKSSTWRIWFGPLDIYAGFRTIAGIRKVSIHYPRLHQPNTVRYIGFTKNFAEQNKTHKVSRKERTHMEWSGLEFSPGYFIEFRFRIPESELRPITLDNAKDIFWLDKPAIGFASEVTIISGPGSHKGLPPRRDDAGQVDHLLEHRLENGRIIWVVHHHIPAPKPTDLDNWRANIKNNINKNHLSILRKLSPNARICVTADCADGSAAEIELATDFLGTPKKNGNC